MPLDDLPKDGGQASYLCREDAFVDAVYQELPLQNPIRPLVTVTWAQTLDFKIASSVGDARLIISGKRSMGVTHRLRCIHDGIMVGIQTLLDDDCQLLVRDIPTTQIRQPQPIILDPALATPLGCRMMRNARAHINAAPWLVASAHLQRNDAFRQRCDNLIEAGAVVLFAKTEPDGRLDLDDVLRMLKAQGIHRLMVEGGMRILVSLLSSPSLIDRIVVTVAPTLAGDGARGPQVLEKVHLIPLRSEVFGHDTIMACAVGTVLGNEIPTRL